MQGVVCLQAIHNGMNCKDYQDDLRIRAKNNAAALQTRQLLEVSEQKVQLLCHKGSLFIIRPGFEAAPCDL